MAGLPVPVPGVAVRYWFVGACGPFALFDADFEPPGPDGESEFLNLVPARQLPQEFVDPLWEGIRAGLGGTAAAVLLTHGRYHEVDSSEWGFRRAGEMAGRAALVRAGLLPPEEGPPGRYVRPPAG
ncbi:hypothetical protein ABZ508_24725 [Streptomyces lavendulocolor]|uniref:Translation elongation factor EFG/EF2 domain-containing protein n=1 Tax=Streptomyces lavendulocolor TaxID=67316 RepID=A0ABV2WB52_9ACTN